MFRVSRVCSIALLFCLTGGFVRSQPSPLRVGGKPPAPVLNIAHRGARAFAPENTLESIAKAARFGCPSGPVADGWAGELPVVSAWAPVGPSADVLPSCLRLRRPWDSLSWPHATRGYFQVKRAIPDILDRLGS